MCAMRVTRRGGVEIVGATKFEAASDLLEHRMALTTVRLGVGTPSAVAYLLDPYLWLPAVVNTAAMLVAEGQLPPILVVGVAHETGDDHHRYYAIRARDLTPVPGVMPATVSTIALRFGTGQAPRFLEFLVDEVESFVEREWGVFGDRAICGWSLSGLFALYALLAAPGWFSRHLAVSPSLFWADGHLLTVAREVDSSTSARVCVVVGGREEPASPAPDEAALTRDTRMTSNARRFVSSLPPSIIARTLIVEGAHHLTSGLAGLFDALRWIYDTDNQTPTPLGA